MPTGTLPSSGRLALSSFRAERAAVPRFATFREVRHAAADMFGLVADVEAYPAFVPLCRAMAVEARTTEGPREVLLARMTVAYGPVAESYTSRIVLDRPALAIDVGAIDGPFRRLDNSWRFTPTGERSCAVRFEIDYEFRSRTLGLLFGAAFERAFRKLSEAFETRADSAYGRGGS